MIEKIGTIKNPLTIIAVFAAIAEISGTVVLPFISDENQATYVWFLIIFPCLLILLFFATLNFNHRVLYAPSDYRNEDNFFGGFAKATFAEKVEQVKDEIKEMNAAPAPAEGSAGPAAGGEGDIKTGPAADAASDVKMNVVASSDRDEQKTPQLLLSDAIDQLASLESAVLAALAKEFLVPIQREVRAVDGGYIFDGVVQDKKVTTIIDVKVLRGGDPVRRIREMLDKHARTIEAIPGFGAQSVRLLLALVLDDDVSKDFLRFAAASKARDLPFSVELRFFNSEGMPK